MSRGAEGELRNPAAAWWHLQPEIEITPEMIEAGIDALCRVLWDMDSYDEIAENVYRSMHAAAIHRSARRRKESKP